MPSRPRARNCALSALPPHHIDSTEFTARYENMPSAPAVELIHGVWYRSGGFLPRRVDGARRQGVSMIMKLPLICGSAQTESGPLAAGSYRRSMLTGAPQLSLGGQICLYDNPPLKEPLRSSTSSRGSWGGAPTGTRPDLAHPNKVIQKRDLMCAMGPPSARPAL
jgi:hypothetical protein